MRLERNRLHCPARLQPSGKRKLKKGENLKNGGSVRKMPKSKSVHLFQDETEAKVPLGENNMT